MGGMSVSRTLSVMACVTSHLSHAKMLHTDAQDMRALCAGDQEAFQRVVRRHQQDVLGYCYRLTTDAELAQDIAQEVFLTLWKKRRNYTEQGKLKHYLIRIARMRSLALLKKTRADKRIRERAIEMRVTSVDSSHPDDAAVQAALGRIRSEHRDLVVLRHLEGFSLMEIQSITGLRLGTIKSRLHRAMAALRTELDDGE